MQHDGVDAAAAVVTFQASCHAPVIAVAPFDDAEPWTQTFYVVDCVSPQVAGQCCGVLQTHVAMQVERCSSPARDAGALDVVEG